MTIKRIAKWILIFLASILLLIALVFGIIVNFIFTPEKLTPKATEIANEYIDGRLDLESVELTFFSTFPELRVSITNGLLVSKKEDSLLAFERINVFLNPISILSDEKIHINELLIQRPIIYAQMDSLGNTNWDILKALPESDTLAVPTSDEPGNDTYIVDNIEIIEGAVKFEDFTNYFSVNIQSLDILGKVSYLNELVDCSLDLSLQNMALTLNDEPIINPVSINFHSRSMVDLQLNLITIDTLNLKVVDHELDIESEGTIQFDSTGAIAVDLKNRLFTSNIREALDLIPLRYMNLTGFQGKGEVDLTADILGVYDENNFPVVVMKLKIMDGQASYKDLPKKIDLFETNLTARIDYLNKASSKIDLPKLRVVSDGLSIDLTGKISQILTNPHVIMSGRGAMDLEDILLTVPMEGLAAKGKADFDLSTDLFLEDIINYDYGKIGINGSINLTGIDINYKNDSILFVTSRTRVKFGQEQNANKLNQVNARLLNLRVNFDDFDLNVAQNLKLEGRRFRMNVNTTPLEDTTMITPVRANFFLNRGFAYLGDTLKLTGNKLNGKVYLRSTKKNPRIPVFSTTFTGDRIRVDQGSNYIAMRNFDYQFRITQRKKKWPMKGQFKFEKVNLFTTAFPQKIVIENTGIGVSTNEIVLDSTNVKIGKSNVFLSGKIYDLQKSIFKQNSFRGDLKVTSDFLNVNQLTRIMDRGAELQQMDVIDVSDTLDLASGDSLVMKTFVVPKRVDFKLRVNLKKIRYGDLVLRGVKGNLVLKDRAIKIRNLKAKTKAADLWMNARYVARNENNARANFNIRLTDVDVKSMMEMMPFMDTLLPMAKDFEGDVNLGMRGFAKIGKNMEINQSSLQAVARLEGQNVVLLDGETFQYLAKTLKFKNREKNVLDSVAVEMAFDNGVLEIFPSLISMDRYRVAIGGLQKLDLTFDYHLSVLKSPLPFKTGIDITGNIDDYDYKITKAKYKYLFSDKEKDKDKIDPELLRRKNEILEKIKFDE